MYLVPVFMLLGHGTNLSRQGTTTAPVPKTITYSLYSFIWQSDKFLDVSIIKYIQMVFLKKQYQSLDSDHLFLRVPTETTEVYNWKPKRNQSPKRRVWKIKARLVILPSKTPTWRKLKLRQAVLSCSSVLTVRNQPSVAAVTSEPAVKGRCNIEHLQVFGIS